MRIIYLTQLFDPEPTFKGMTFVRELAGKGYDVEVVTGFPNYPGGKLYEGYRVSPLRRETRDGIAITRLAMYPAHGPSGLKRIVSYASFAVSATAYLLFGAKRASLVLVFYPSLTAGLAAAFAKLFRRTPVIVDIQDMWPDSLPATGMVTNGTVLKLIDWACRLQYRMSDRLIVLSEGFKRLLIGRGVPEAKLTVIRNWAEESASSQADNTFATRLFDGERFNVLFAGNMGAAQGMTTVIEAAARLQARDSKVFIHLMGAGVEVDRLKAMAGAKALDNVRFHPRVALHEVNGYLQAADALLVHLNADPLFEITIPSKTQAYLYAGRPIVMAVDGEAARMVSEADAGLVCSPQDADALADTLEGMAGLPEPRRREMGINGRSYYDRRLALHIAMDQIDALIRDTARKD